jgi:hypothetical protein
MVGIKYFTPDLVNNSYYSRFILHVVDWRGKVKTPLYQPGLYLNAVHDITHG